MIHEMSHLYIVRYISNSTAHDISTNVLIYMYVRNVLDLIHRVWGAKLSLHLPSSSKDVDGSDGTEQCAAQSHRSCA